MRETTEGAEIAETGKERRSRPLGRRALMAKRLHALKETLEGLSDDEVRELKSARPAHEDMRPTQLTLTMEGEA